MKKRFSEGSSIHDYHDYLIYKAHEKTLMGRYEQNYKNVSKEIQKLLPDVSLSGQWSVDVMQNGGDFWLIDMAQAADSALKECVPAWKLRKAEEDWMPRLGPAKE